ncbi:hypothetical protein HY440_01185 [Candidatus Microgenomates bacterium]|nr:hypothetical protein [Candidatus Microgenomates bacterium]
MKPETLEGLKRYAEQGIPTGGFLRAVLENNLMEAFGQADIENTADMAEIVGYVYNEMPMSCHGSPEKVKAWLARPWMVQKKRRSEMEEVLELKSLPNLPGS